MASLIESRPFHMGSQRSTAKTMVNSNFELVNLKGKTGGIVIAVTETTPPPTLTQITTPPKARVAGSQRPPSPLGKASPRSRAGSPSQSPSPIRSHTSSPTLVRSGSFGSTGTHSPVLRSMFPRFNPNVPLSQQKYYPNMERVQRVPVWTNDSFIRPEYSPSMYSEPHSPEPTLPTDKPKPASSILTRANETSSNLSKQPQPQLSTPEELLDVWSIANGQASESALEAYTLSLHCRSLAPSNEIFSLTSSTSHPLYTLTATNPALTITRTHPLNPSLNITTTSPTLHNLTPTSPLISTLFPKLAELMALDQSSTISSAHKLPRKEAAALQSEALARAQATESASLLWDSDSESYFLQHPRFSSPSSSAPTIFPIIISQDEVCILSSHSAAADPLLTLALATKTLTIHTTPLLALPSLYTLDILLSALLTLLLHLHRSASQPLNPPTLIPTRPLSLPTFAPPPTLHPSPSLRSLKSTRARNNPKRKTLLSTFTSTSPDLEAASETLTPSSRFSSSSPPSLDLSTFQPFLIDDPNLPRGTRMALRMLYGGFGALVWALGMLVSVLAAGIVGLGSLVKRL